MTDPVRSCTRAGTFFRHHEIRDGDMEGGEGLEALQAQVNPQAMLMMLQEQQRMMAEQHQAQQRVLLEMLPTQQEEQRAYRQEMEELRRREAAEHREEARHKMPKPGFKKLEETDDIENFLETFERVATQQHWPDNVWAGQLAGLLTGRAQAAYAALDATEAQEYKKVKEAILHRFDVNQETHRRRFRENRKGPEESYREWLCRITSHFDKWCKDSTMPMKELVIMEQALWSMPEGLTVWLRERQPKSLDELAKLAEDYTLARKSKHQPFGPKKTPVSPGTQEVKPQGTRTPQKKERDYIQSQEPRSMLLGQSNVSIVTSGGI